MEFRLRTKKEFLKANHISPRLTFTLFAYRKNGTRFDCEHIQYVQRSGRTSVPVLGCGICSDL